MQLIAGMPLMQKSESALIVLHLRGPPGLICRTLQVRECCGLSGIPGLLLVAMIFVLSPIAKYCYLPEFVAKASTCLIFYWNFEYVRCNFIMRDVNALTQENALVTVKL